MKVSEKSLELNVGAELLAVFRNDWAMPKSYLRGLTQREESQEGVDFFVQLDPATRIFAFQFKAPKGSADVAPYRYTLKNQQHDLLFKLAQVSRRSVFYVFPYYVTVDKIHQDVPDLIRDTWLLSVDAMPTDAVFGAAPTKEVWCQDGLAEINPNYLLEHLRDLDPPHGIPIREFASWYNREYREAAKRVSGRADPWLARGLRVVIALP